MGKLIDEMGNRYGRLTVIGRDSSSAAGTRWLARCECGQSRSVLAKLLRNGHTQSCGCIHRELLRERRLQPLPEGIRFGRLVVLQRGNNIGKHSRYLVRCDCGTEKLVGRENLRSGRTQSCGCLHREEVVRRLTKPTPIGVRFGRLTVLGSGPKNGRRGMWYVRCDCGKEKLVCSENVRGGNTQTCGCVQRNGHPVRKETAARTVVLSGYRLGAKKRGLSWELSVEEFVTLTSSDCHYCGRAPFRVQKVSGRKDGGDSPGSSYTYNGIDRVDNAIGYELDNCVPCCTECNRAKMDRSYEEFIEWSNRMHLHLIERPMQSDRNI